MREKKTEQRTVEQRAQREEYRARVAANRERRKAVAKDKEQACWLQMEMFGEKDVESDF